MCGSSDNLSEDAREEHTWDALYTMGSLFRQAELVVAGAFGFPYPEGDGARVSVFIRQIQALPRDAEVDAVTFDAAASGTGRELVSAARYSTLRCYFPLDKSILRG